jgi:hypothetical protein
VIGPALLATAADLGFGLLVACIVSVLAAGVYRWTQASSQIEAARLATDPAEPVDFAAEIEAYRIARDQEYMGERRAA